MENRTERISMADDSCLFCGLHGEEAGGHLFIGKRNKDGNLISDTGWLCIEHLACCAVQICPGCVAKYHLTEGDFNPGSAEL